MVKNLRPHTVVIDIGAKVGETAIYFAQWHKIDKVIAYEPMPFLYDKEVENVRVHHSRIR